MNDPTTCPCCGVVVMPPQLSYDFDGETVASLTREVAYLRATVARLRGLPLPREHHHELHGGVRAGRLAPTADLSVPA